jgi:hypothetical protein
VTAAWVCFVARCTGIVHDSHTQGRVVAARRFAAISKGGFFYFYWLCDADAGSFMHGEKTLSNADAGCS